MLSLVKEKLWTLGRETKALSREVAKKHNVTGRHGLVCRSKNTSALAIVVAGYAPELWPFSLERLARFSPAWLDICIVSPGVYSATLAEYAERHKWSYLWTKANQLALAQNLAILAHPSAEWLFKMDEDIFISEGYFSGLLCGWNEIVKEGRYDIGFVAPLLNVNGYSYVPFLQRLGLLQIYAEKFGEIKQACMGVRAHGDPDAARFLWMASTPFDPTARSIREQGFAYSAVPQRFSIGAILIRRSYWSELGGFQRALIGGHLGIEERKLCNDCVQGSRAMIVVHNVLAGHFAFGPQRAAMRSWLPEMAADLSSPWNSTSTTSEDWPLDGTGTLFVKSSL